MPMHMQKNLLLILELHIAYTYVYLYLQRFYTATYMVHIYEAIVYVTCKAKCGLRNSYFVVFREIPFCYKKPSSVCYSALHWFHCSSRDFGGSAECLPEKQLTFDI